MGFQQGNSVLNRKKLIYEKKKNSVVWKGWKSPFCPWKRLSENMFARIVPILQCHPSRARITSIEDDKYDRLQKVEWKTSKIHFFPLKIKNYLFPENEFFLKRPCFTNSRDTVRELRFLRSRPTQSIMVLQSPVRSRCTLFSTKQ